jgi:hypothetical protein
MQPAGCGISRFDELNIGITAHKALSVPEIVDDES